MKEWKYILAADGKTPIPESDVLRWGSWFEHIQNRIIRRDYFAREKCCKPGPIMVSTVFLGIDHAYLDRQKPLLFETMIFGLDSFREYCEWYTSYEDAMLGHQAAVGMVLACGYALCDEA